ncbi:MAG: peptidylprolyl isomerase [Candidatus Binatia bacterium]|nr:peptidylprolyl isomerase [Candidatus Binatia bacterium]
MMKSTITRATAVAVSVGLLAGSAVYESYAKTEPADTGPGMVLALANPTSPQDVVVVVNGHEVTRGEVDREIDSMLGGQLANVPAEQLDGIRAQVAARVTDGVIVKTLLEQAVETQGIQVDDAKMADAMKKIEASLPEGKTMADYMTAMGTTKAEFQDQLGMSLRVDTLIERKMGKIPEPTEANVTAFYEENGEMFDAPERAEVSHILVAMAPDADPAAKAEKRKEAEAVRAELVAQGGADFATVAGLRSDCPSKAEGGKLGMLARGDTVPPFEAAVFSQDVGAVGPVVETPFGFHIVRVEGREPAGKVSMAEAKPFIEQRLAEEQQRAAVVKYLDGLRADAKVVYPSKEAA